MKSSSHLTRAVFRAILNNRPYTVAECRRQYHHSSWMTAKPAKLLVPYVTRRNKMFDTIFNTVDRGFEGAKNTPKNLEIALGRLVDFVRASRTQSRGPSDEEVLDAFKFLFYSRLDSQRQLTRNEVYLATEVFKHLQEKGLIGMVSDKATLQRNDLDNMLRALALRSEHERFRSDTRGLATAVYSALLSATEPTSLGYPSGESTALLPVYVTILARTGSALDALKLIQQSTNQDIQHSISVWIEVLKGLGSEGRRKEFDACMREVQGRVKSLSITEYEELVLYLANNNNFVEARKVYESQVANGISPTTEELKSLVGLCIRAKELEYGKSFAQVLEQRLDEDGALGTLLIWIAASQDDMRQVMNSIRKLIDATPASALSMSPFNQLIDFSYSTNRQDIAGAVLEVAQEIGLQPDGRFFALQLNYALARGDVSVAVDCYEEMTRQDIPTDNLDIEVLNKFIASLAFAPEPNYNLLMRVVDYLLERNADFDAEALAGVCHVFLQRDELEDLTGLLRHRVDFYPSIDRARISAVFQSFILDTSVKDQRAFNAYEIFRVAFPETPVALRLPLMQSFFDRNRPDLACLVFGHMRQREDMQARPTADAYAKCFAGIAQCRDIDGLQMVYNMLKLDLEVDMTTKVRNGLMLAYIACQMPYTAMIDHFWKIMDSREGPSYSTFEVALRACESWIPQGGYEARKVMAIVQAWNLEITKELYDCYIGAVAGQSEFENTIELIEEMENEIGERPDVYTIGTFYNAIPWQYRKDEVEKWAKKAYPDLWEELETFGDEIDEEWEIRYFKIDRSINIDDDPLFAQGEYDPQISRNAVQALEPPPEKPKSTENTL